MKYSKVTHSWQTAIIIAAALNPHFPRNGKTLFIANESMAVRRI